VQATHSSHLHKKHQRNARIKLFQTLSTGKITDTTFLQILYEEFAKNGMVNMMKATNKALTAVKAYEDGKISKAKAEIAAREFEIIIVELAQANDRARQQQQQYQRQQFTNNLKAVGQGLQAVGNGYNAGRVRMNCMTAGVGNTRMTNCY
jgi:hypothetical protein